MTMTPHATPLAPAASRGDRAPDSPPQSLADAFRRVIHGGRSVVDLALATKLPAKWLYRWASDPSNESLEYRPAPAYAIETLTLATGRLDLLTYLADRAGCVVVRRPDADCSVGTLLSDVSGLTGEFADVQHGCAEGLTDGVVDPDEARAIANEVTQLQARAEVLRMRMAALVDAQRRPLAKAGAR